MSLVDPTRTNLMWSPSLEVQVHKNLYHPLRAISMCQRWVSCNLWHLAEVSLDARRRKICSLFSAFGSRSLEARLCVNKSVPQSGGYRSIKHSSFQELTPVQTKLGHLAEGHFPSHGVVFIH